MPLLDNTIPLRLTEEYNAAVNKHSKGDQLLGQCRVEEAEALLRDALDWSQKSLGSYHQMTVVYQEHMADLLAQLGKFDEAIELNMTAWRAREKAQDSSRGRHTALFKLARDLRRNGWVQEAASHMEHVYLSQLRDTATFGPDDHQTLRAGHELATCWFLLGDISSDNYFWTKAKDLHEDVLQRQLCVKGIDGLDIVRTRGALGASYYRLHEYWLAKDQFSAGAVALKSLKSDAAGGKGREKAAGDQVHFYRRLHEIESTSRYFDEMRTKLKVVSAESIRNGVKSNPQPSNPRSAFMGITDEPSRDTPAGHSRSTMHQMPQIRVDEATPSTTGSGTRSRRKSHTGIRNASPVRGRSPRASAPDLLKPDNATPTRRRSNSSPQSSDKSPSESTLRNSQSVRDPRSRPNTEQTDKDAGHRNRRSRSPRQEPQETGSRESTNQNLANSHARIEQQQRKPWASSSYLEEFHNRGKQIPRSVSAPPQENPTDSTRDQQTRPASSNSRSKAPEPPASPTGPITPSVPEAEPQPRHYSLPERPSRSPLPVTTGAFFDSKQGSSSHESEMWFRDLAAKTHALLAPLQTAAFRRVRVAVLDTGIHMGQINLWDKDRAHIVRGKNPRIKKKHDFLDPDRTNKCMDLDGHGTHCVGVIRKVAPEADIYVARVAVDCQTGPNPTAVIEALNHAWNTWKVDIISLSFGFETWIEPLAVAIRNALAKNTLVLAATSNYGTSRRMTFPANMPEVISLHAADSNGSSAGTNPVVEHGKNLTILGVDVVSAWIPKTATDASDDPITHVMTGTSVATPMAAGIGALVLEFARQRDPSGDPETDKILGRLRPRLQEQRGMESVFRAMARATEAGAFSNIVPWTLLCAYPNDDDEHLGRRIAAHNLARVVVDAFGELPPSNQI